VNARQSMLSVIFYQVKSLNSLFVCKKTCDPHESIYCDRSIVISHSCYIFPLLQFLKNYQTFNQELLYRDLFVGSFSLNTKHEKITKMGSRCQKIWESLL
jgi:hypothetical protein